MYPIRSVGHEDVTPVERIPPARINRESDEEAAERRRREQQEQERERKEKGEPAPGTPGQPAIVPADRAHDGHPHCDIRV